MEVILESKNKRIRIKEIVGNIGKTYSIYLDGKCQSKLIKEKTFNDLKNNLNLQEEVNKLSENLNNNIYLHLIDLMYEKLIDENGFDIKEAKTEIYTSKMLEILPFLEEFFPSHYVLGGGTAIALHLGHRESIDFDFLIQNPKEFENFNVKNFLKFFQDKGFDASIDYNTDLQMDFSINGVKTTILNVSGNNKQLHGGKLSFR